MTTPRRSAGALLLLTAVTACGAQSRPATLRTISTTVSPTPTPTPHSECSAFALSLVSDRGGQPTPTAAATRFSGTSGWQVVATDHDGGTTLRRGSATLHTVEGPDGTWQVDSGQDCA